MSTEQEPTMTEHTEANEHIDAISEIVSSWIAIAEFQDMLGVLADIKEIPEHLDALAARLAAAEAEADQYAGLLNDISILARDAHDERADRLAVIEEIYALASSDGSDDDAE